MTEAIRIVVVDDHPLYRDGLGQALSSVPDLEVVGVAADGAEAIVVVDELLPDVVVMDVQMPVLDGIAATRQLTARHPHLAVLMLTMAEDDDTVFQAMRAGARGYVLKGARQDDVARAVRGVAAGEALFGPGVAQRIGAYFARLAVSEDPAGAFPELTRREREILDLVAAGRSNPAIAHELFLSPKTVRNNVSNIFAKLQVADRAQAIVKARDAGLGRGEATAG
ncbi:DNA-binding response regulator [Agromyces tardus]|jgi:DNA-binding NarL/FixJ family response regulator|uniref:DNA-binding response regulator n=1 Tax=Agromyces tardus TaxID=2583849 RepID=A0A3M8AJP1_9MICO|nr:response regulator transcription factor [Agromyces tardus]RNB51259.1 DNA-binding response regulator [Agromyces tardus]